jgi:Phosphodiester glycosidase
VAYRTFLQPDPTRPYTLVAVVAIDLTRTRLHFVLGSDEPAGPPGPPRSGAIPPSDRVANVLLAAFNGGFKARHGLFGAMADGITALPPRDGLGTVVIYKDGSVHLGEWGADLTISPDLAAFRQNGPLVVQHGQINPRIHNNLPEDWGYTVIDVSPTVRTGIGLSADEKTLFYFCGPSLSMEALAKSMQAAGAWNAIQLDINNYWALFVKFQPSGSNLIPEALLPNLMVANIERYLWDYSRDYFYITGIIK